MKWNARFFGDLAEFRNGLNFLRSDNGALVKVVGVSDFQRRFRISFADLEEVQIAGEIRDDDLLHDNDLLFVRSNGNKALIGRCLLIQGLQEPTSFSGFTIRARITGSEVDPTFVGYYFQSASAKRAINFAGGGTNISNLSQGILSEIEIPTPPLPEQHKIADILTTWDEAIEKLDALIAAKTRRKQALMQLLLTGKKRVKGATGKWKKVQLGDLAENRSDQNKGKLGTESLYGVTKADGVVPMRDHVKGESFHRCKLLDHDWFAYNPMRINIGSIARWQGKKTVMVSGDYVVFRCFEDRLSPAYLDHLRQSWMWQSFVTKGGNGSVRIRIYFSDLAEFTFSCPPIEEQRQIAKILDSATNEITLLRRQRDTLDQQKRGLMQRLLTGKVRVTTNHPASK
jgi:type I restriction enzyme S subunit